MARGVGWSRWLKVIGIAAAIAFLLVLAWPALSFWVRAAVFDYLVEEIVQWTHFPSRVVKGVLLLIAFPAVWAAGVLLRVRLPAFRPSESEKRARQRLGAVACLLVYGALFYFVTGLASRDIYFGRNGEPLKFCFEMVGSLRCEDSPGFDRDGNPLVPVTREMVARHRQRLRGTVPGRVVFSSLAEFDRATFIGSDGQARIWAGTSVAGDRELFDGPGYHPSSGDPLVPVTPEFLRTERARLAGLEQETVLREQERAVAQDLRENRAAAARKQAWMDRYVDPRVKRAGQPAVLIASQDGVKCSRCTEVVAGRIGAGQDLFRSPLLQDGLFRRAVAGETEVWEELGLAEYPAALVVASEETSSRADSLDPALRVVSVSYGGHVLAGGRLRAIAGEGQVADFNEGRAVTKARELALEALVANTLRLKEGDSQ